MTENFADRLLDAVDGCGTPAVVGLDPRLESMPPFLLDAARRAAQPVREAIRAFHEIVLDEAAGRVAAVKPQIAFFEQYGIEGLQAFADTLDMARERGLLVIADAKRNDIDSTAAAYANAFLGAADVFGARRPAFAADALTVTPYLGRDTLRPFVDACAEHGKGIFVLVKTSNPGSGDLQDLRTDDGRTIAERVADMVAEAGEALTGARGYSAVGAVVGATYPAEARALRDRMPRAIVLVPGYGAQGGGAADAVAAFDAEGRGALVNAARTITYPKGEPAGDEASLRAGLARRIEAMAADLAGALAAR
ncbi:MAG TPA: orotidine-5'-phosphate decarboxylase [Egibacteraceae bacterium]|nr:orotidine-5'-phosphate decarboxylase [Egibacteraceae bacterium]